MNGKKKYQSLRFTDSYKHSIVGVDNESKGSVCSIILLWKYSLHDHHLKGFYRRNHVARMHLEDKGFIVDNLVVGDREEVRQAAKVGVVGKYFLRCKEVGSEMRTSIICIESSVSIPLLNALLSCNHHVFMVF
jgi:hypothetical protein